LPRSHRSEALGLGLAGSNTAAAACYLGGEGVS
jgi:hypothetical protein